MINKKDLELKLLLRESHIQQLNLKVDNLSNTINTLLQRNDDLKQEIERLNNILDTLMQDMAVANAIGKQELKPKYVFDRIVMLRGVDKE